MRGVSKKVFFFVHAIVTFGHLRCALVTADGAVARIVLVKELLTAGGAPHRVNFMHPNHPLLHAKDLSRLAYNISLLATL